MNADNIIVKWYTLPHHACHCFVRHLSPNGIFLGELVWTSPEHKLEVVEGILQSDAYNEVIHLIEKIQNLGSQGGSPWVGLLATGDVSTPQILFTCRDDDASLSATYFWQITALLQPYLLGKK